MAAGALVLSLEEQSYFPPSVPGWLHSLWFWLGMLILVRGAIGAFGRRGHSEPDFTEDEAQDQ